MPRHYFAGERAHQGLKKRLSAYQRIALVEDVDVENGTVSFKWLDHPGGRDSVQISQPSFGTWEWPMKGAVVLVAFSEGDTAHIVRYLPVGYAHQVSLGWVRKLFPGEKLWQSYGFFDKENNRPVPTGTEIFMNRRGDVTVSTGYGGYWEIRRDENLISQSSMNWEVENEAGQLVMGLVRREETDDYGAPRLRVITKTGVPVSTGGEALTEFHLKVLETADATPGTTGLDNPLVELVLGTVVDSSGSRTDGEFGEKVCVRLRTKSDIGFQFDVDKAGNVYLKVLSGATLKVVCDNVEVEGDNIQLGDSSARALIDERAITLYDGHTHTGVTTGPGVSGAPVILWSASSVKTSKTKAS